jgi:transcriptional regulator with XRE-family HTH domain
MAIRGRDHIETQTQTPGEDKVIVGDRLKAIREMKNMSQGDIEKRTGLLRCYTSRVENGHTVPSVETLEKYARALEVPLYQIFFDSENGEAKELKLPKRAGAKISKKDASLGARLSQLVSHMDARDKKLLVGFAQKLARR